MRGLTLVVGLVAMLPAASAQQGLIMGTEDGPELPDAVGDVQYHPLYVGAKDHAYIDFAAAWFEYDHATDEILLTMKTPNSEGMSTAAATWNVGCAVRGILVADGEAMGRLSFAWSVNSNDQPEGGVSWQAMEDESAVSGTLRSVGSGFTYALGAPAYFRWHVARGNLTLLGDVFEEPSGYCFEFLENSVALVINEDFAESDAVYSIADAQHFGPGLESEAGDAVRDTSGPSTSAFMEEATPALSMGVILAALLASGFATRRKR